MITKKQFNKWVKGLESGNYKKGICRLKYNNKFCCLGVLAHQLGTLDYSGTDSVTGDKGFISTLVLPKSTQNELTDVNDSSDTWEPVIAKIKTMEWRIVT